MDPRDRFTSTVDDYEKYRPDYPIALLRWVARHGRRVVDVGSGTGILSRQLARLGLDVVGVEPNAAMRKAAEDRGGGPRYVAGDAEATGLPSASADVAVAAQAFHWFDLDRAVPELERVAKMGRIVAAWNVRDGTGFSAAYDGLLAEVSDDYRAVPKPEPTLARLRAMRPTAVTEEAPHHQALDLDAVLGRAWSSSYVVHGVSDAPEFDSALTALYDAHAEGGVVRMGYRTVWLSWRA